MGRRRLQDKDDEQGCCATPGTACSFCCRSIFGLLGLGFVYIYIVSYIFGESGTPQVLWLTGVVIMCGCIALVIYGVAIVCCSCLGDWPLTVIAGVSAFAMIGGLQLFLGGADPPSFF